MTATTGALKQHSDSAKESGHPVRHAFTRSIPTAQCMNCHMHQPNIFLNSFLGYTMWDYESRCAAACGPSQAEISRPRPRKSAPCNERNPEAAAAPKGKWADVDFLRQRL